MLLFFAILAFVLDQLFSSRAAYIHVGAAIGTVMVANVFFVIIPGQRELVAALRDDRQPDPEPGRNALLRSRHNNYLTLPVLFTMISSHFPSTYGNDYGWAVLIALGLVGVGVRHYFNVRHIAPRSIWMLPVAFAALVAVMLYTAPRHADHEPVARVPDSHVAIILRERCISCHAPRPTQPAFSAPPAGLSFESLDTVIAHARRIYVSAVATNTMPLGNLTGMTEEERVLLGLWLETKIEETQ
ncbi:MAG: hypothetical protein DWQ08_02665 [Proteobacteria bacterium]|nr:MAG: hypothetical protein DWQ08_02665 [Pseudomonadota bacterium]